jgi:hypothetical protein
MRGLFYTTAAAAALALGSTAANAAALVLSPTATVTVAPPASGTFGDSFNPATAGMFTDVFNINLTGSALTDASLISVSLGGGNNIDFACATCSVRLDTTAFTLVSTGTLDTFTLSPINLSAGLHALTITGNIGAGPSASFAGTINFNTATAPVPEAATWGMMILGFAGIGMALRRRRRPVLTQLA